MNGDITVLYCTVLSHAQYVPTLTAAAALRIKAALSTVSW